MTIFLSLLVAKYIPMRTYSIPKFQHLTFFAPACCFLRSNSSENKSVIFLSYIAFDDAAFDEFSEKFIFRNSIFISLICKQGK